MPRLVQLGYDEEQRSNVSIRYNYPIQAQQGRDKRTIYADIVVFVDSTPVIVADAKNPRQYLTENDREQVISYARLIGNVAPFAALSNGHTWRIFDAVSKEEISTIPSYDALLADLQRRRLSESPAQEPRLPGD